jgi:protocatechuate 3,4-dioxygenase, alpha subunit
MRLRETPTQTVGPFFAVMPDWPDGQYAVPKDTDGAFWLRGRLYDGAGDPVPDGVLELWQAGRNPLFARCLTDAQGDYGFLTTRPEALPGPDGLQAPHIALSVFARGLLDRVVTRAYLADDGPFDDDTILSTIDPAVRETLVAHPDGSGGYRFDIHLQGEHETVFFDI